METRGNSTKNLGAGDIPVMYSHGLPPLKLADGKSRELISACEFRYDPVALSGGALQFPIGRYASVLFETPEKQWLQFLLQAPHSDDIQIGPLVADKVMAARLNIPEGTVLPGQYLQDGHGSSIRRLKVIAWQDAQSREKWLDTKMLEHQMQIRTHRWRHLLIRLTKNRWSCDGVVYRIVPMRQRGGHFMRDAKGQRLHEVRITIAPETQYELPNDSRAFTKGLTGFFLNAGSQVYKGMTHDKAVEFVQSHFRLVGPRLHAGGDAYLGRKRDYALQNGHEPDGFFKKSWHKIKGLREAMRERPIRRFYVSLGFAFSKMSWRNTREAVVTSVAPNAFVFGLSLLTNQLAFTLAALWAVGAKVGGQSILKLYAKGRSVLGIRAKPDYDDTLALICRQYSVTDSNGGRLNPDMQPYLHVVPFDQLNTDLGRSRPPKDGLNREQSAYRYLCNIFTRMAGSHVQGFELGAYEGLSVYQPGGLYVEYLPGAQTVFAYMDHARRTRETCLIPRKVVNAFLSANPKTPYLRMHINPKTRRISGRFLSQAQYIRAMQTLQTSVPAPALPLPQGRLPLPPPQPRINVKARKKQHQNAMDMFHAVNEIADGFVDRAVDGVSDTGGMPPPAP